MLNFRRCITALIWLTLTWPHGTALAEPTPSPKVVFVIVDGIPADVIERVATPHLDAIAIVGAYARAQMGGPVGEPGETPTVSAPGYMSLVTGTWANKHNVYENYNLSPNYGFWNIFRVAKAANPAIKIGIFSTWTDNRTVLLGEGQPGAGDWRFDHIADGFERDEKRFPPQPSGKHIAVIDRVISEEAASAIVRQGPDLSWIYLQHTDDVGHQQGDGEVFDSAVVEMDMNVGRIWSAVEARQATHSEDWLVIVTTDHGRDALTGRQHGGHSERERTIWIATNSQRLTPEFYMMPDIVDIYPSIATHLGINIPEQVARHLDGASFIR
ncbi:MAG: nucleotide pyrophosphatase [Halieaceae bacterium]|nr:nucleotide pyrophosphatase [Halieaceae bacterium]